MKNRQVCFLRKIIINGRFLLQKVTGVQRYARELVWELDKITPKGEIIIAVPPELEELPRYQNIQVIKVGRLRNRLWEHLSFPMYVAMQKGVSLNLCNVAPLLSPGIVCIHDVKIKAAPRYFSKGFLAWYRLLFWNALSRAKAIITVSEFSKREIMKYYGVSTDRIVVIPNAWQHFQHIGYDGDALNKYGLVSQSYFFSMCSLEPNKNFKWVAEVAKRNPEQVFAVSGSINSTVFQEGLGFECPENMKLLGYASDTEAKTLMRECRAFLFPTFYEGFGIPPLEALSAGAKCIVVSDTEVMHEIFGDHVVYIDPVCYDCNLEELVKAGAVGSDPVLSRFSWEHSAKKLLEALKTI